MTIIGSPHRTDMLFKASQDPESLAVPSPIALHRPRSQTIPLVIASPHSGSNYDPHFLASSKLDPVTLRRSEDAHVHILCGAAPDLGAPLLHALFPRAYLDANREPYELDPRMFSDPLPSFVNTRSPRVSAGLGTIARTVGSGTDIYRGKLTFAEAKDRIDRCYHPYHETLKQLIDETKAKFGYCLLLDCHSMPSGLVRSHKIPASARPGADFVLGDCHGRSCNRIISNTVQAVLTGLGYHTARNAPYAGGYTTRHYGAPDENVHVLQIEISRHLYMHEETYQQNAGFPTIQKALTAVFRELSYVDLGTPPSRGHGLLG